jgi:hypothetical protein
MLCWSRCDWGNCEDGEIQFDGFQQGKLQLEVNGQGVSNMTKFGDDHCYFLWHKDGYYFKANENGQYDLKTNVGLFNETRPDILSFIRFATLAVF